MTPEQEIFLYNTLILLKKLREYAVKHVKPVLPPAASIELHLENNLGFIYKKYEDKFEFYVRPEKIHKIKHNDKTIHTINPIKYYPETIPMVRKLLELSTIGVYYPEIIEKFLMENI